MTTPPSPGHVFMSYSRKDEAVMWRIATFLRNQGINVWVDNEKLVPGTPIWEAEIEKAIKAASAVMVILSPDSKNSEWVRREISFADQYRTRIFPVLVRGDEEASITLRLITRQYVDIRQNEEVGLNSLRAALSSYLEELKAQEWRSGEEAERLAREKAQREAAERAAREKEEREVAENAARKKAEYEAKLKATLDEIDRKAAERTLREKADREVAEKAAREKAEREAADKAARERAAKLEEFKRKEAEKLAREKATREIAEREAVEKTAHEKANRTESYLGVLLGVGLAIFYLVLYGEGFADAFPLAILLILASYVSVRLVFPHKISVVFLLIGFFIAGLTLEANLSDYPENFILLGGIVGIPAGAVLSWILALGKVLK